jgi:hypothetical protein
MGHGHGPATGVLLGVRRRSAGAGGRALWTLGYMCVCVYVPVHAGSNFVGRVLGRGS